MENHNRMKNECYKMSKANEKKLLFINTYFLSSKSDNDVCPYDNNDNLKEQDNRALSPATVSEIKKRLRRIGVLQKGV